MNTIQKAKQMIKERKKELRAFDALPIKEQMTRTECGLNPHEPEEVRIAKQRIIRELARVNILKLPATVQARLSGFAKDPQSKKGTFTRRDYERRSEILEMGID